MDKIDVVFEDISDDFVFNGPEGKTITWKELKGILAEQIIKTTPVLVEKGIKRVEVGTIQWFSDRRKTRGHFIPLNTMFLARLLKAASAVR
ncbi:MAG: hypothetical protein IBX41_05450 [Methanophagales archaeon]|nr:hypothetical protein [Methanophagales archaeon]